MTRCGRTAHLEAVALGEASPALTAELRAHTKGCALCRHELNWLESEAALFRQRAGRDEVAQLWKGVADRSGLEPRPRAWPRVLVALAAAAALVLMVGNAVPRATPFADGSAGDETLESSMLMTPAFFMEEEPCSRLPSGVGFQCSPVVPASFLASR